MCDGIRPDFLLFRYFIVSRVCMICSIYCTRNMCVYTQAGIKRRELIIDKPTMSISRRTRVHFPTLSESRMSSDGTDLSSRLLFCLHSIVVNCT
jgi:hypothetical protein